MSKINISKEELYELYIAHNNTREEIAEKFGCSVSTIKIYLKKYNITKRINISKEELYELYIVHNLTIKQVAEKCGCGISKIKILLKEYNIVKSEYQILETCKQTNLKKHGVENPMQSEEVREKFKKTCKERLGVENPSQSKEVQEKIKQTNLKKRGVENPFQSEDVQEKSKQTCKEKFNCEYASQRHIPIDKIEIYRDKDNLINYLNTIDYEERTSSFCSKDLGIDKDSFNRYIIKYGIFDLINHSKSEWENVAKRWFENSYPELTVHYNIRSIIKPKELDIYIPEYNIAIELNGSYWHSDKAIQERTNMSAEEYHNLKEQLCKEKGITLYTIWDNEITKDNTLEDCLEKIFKKHFTNGFNV